MIEKRRKLKRSPTSTTNSWNLRVILIQFILASLFGSSGDSGGSNIASIWLLVNLVQFILASLRGPSSSASGRSNADSIELLPELGVVNSMA
mmetsp:Transcript_3371/g.5190  ORF Transcript_3371/g.5190 Transcript_3371/m.5190 type:complete len:92 (-) Transcript_3371:952-1227(-)